MTMEPLSGVMSAQAQMVQNRQQMQMSKPAVEAAGSDMSDAVKVDNRINAVNSGGEKGNADEEGQDGRQGSNNEKIKKAVERLNKNMQNSEAIFGIHDQTNRVMIKIIDKNTREVIKELPPEKTLDMIAKVWEMAGMLVDEKR